jgi:IclR family KDG regulon transcriptional repressor
LKDVDFGFSRGRRILDKTTAKALLVLETLARSNHARGVTELAQELDLTKSNIYRILYTLETHGYVKQDAETERYALTLKMWELGSLVISRLDLRQEALSELQLLAAKIDETIYLSMLIGSDIVHVHMIESSKPLRAHLPIGGRPPMFATATGKAILAYQPDEFITRVSRTMTEYTQKTVKGLDALQKELSEIRKRGYAINTGEWNEGICGLAAPLYSSSSTVTAAIGIGLPALRLTPKRIKDLSRDLIDTATAISVRLGHRATAKSTREARPR